MKHGISISDMAKLHGLTRQTLLYYDKIGLFKPENVDDKGYRYYSWRQIPVLREICFLKATGIPLKDIVGHFQNRTAHKELILLDNQKIVIEEEIGRLQRLRQALDMRIQTYRTADEAIRMHQDEPFLLNLPSRQVLYREYLKPVHKENLHRTLMELWKNVTPELGLPAGRFGTMILQEYARTDHPIDGAGSCFFLPEWEQRRPEAITLPAGEYACLFSYHMPYDMTAMQQLLQWMDGQGLELGGHVVDICLLDTTFYTTADSVDFCLLQAPVYHRNK
ncbi:MerR family transcriptional regulator [Megasphaera sp. WILCCON 0056]|uniref:MerR family transcriptional regulator n=1 Tax=Megasphaera sp. WILCCON 0056 TaxID=3345340 RepID=UPI003A8106CB